MMIEFIEIGFTMNTNQPVHPLPGVQIYPAKAGWAAKGFVVSLDDLVVDLQSHPVEVGGGRNGVLSSPELFNQ